MQPPTLMRSPIPMDIRRKRRQFQPAVGCKSKPPLVPIALAAAVVIMAIVSQRGVNGFDISDGGSSAPSTTYGSSMSDSLQYESWQCDFSIASESVRVSAPPDGANRLLELHVRSNVKGDVDIRDAHTDDNAVHIDITKSTNNNGNGHITVNQTLFDTGHGTIFVLQIDYVRKVRAQATLLVSSTIAGAICLVIVLLLSWWLYNRRRRFTPINNQSIAASSASTAISGTTVGTGLVELSADCTDFTVRSSRNVVDRLSCQPASVIGSGADGAASPIAGGTLNRATLMTLGLVCLTSSVVYGVCPYDPVAQVVIAIPPSSRLDLPNCQATDRPPCLPREICPNADVQSLAGCDAVTGRCVCQRGYDFVGGVCMDIDECAEGLSRCPDTATCLNAIGSYDCQCSYGFYGTAEHCHKCSVGCPDGMYESSPCTNTKDRVCSECSRCSGSSYEVRPCSSTADRQCIHVAHPLLVSGETTMPTLLDGLKVDKSANVFIEDLHNTRNLETTVYITDMAQASDFYWDRESKLRVNIGIHDVHLIPEYRDVDHDGGDNKYMLNNPNNSEDKNKFRNIQRNYCRYPIPDYYSITLEISRDRSTSAAEITCNSKDPTRLPCPPGYNDGDVYLRRTLNEPCKQMGAYPEPLQSAANSIVCTDSSAPLLREVFNQTYGIERPIRFPPKRCKTAASRCEQCLNQARCLALDLFEKKCCHVDCYTLMDCKMMVSNECTSAPVECAMGNAYRYTIQPMFQNIKSEFQCHVKLQRPQRDVLYELFFYVQTLEGDSSRPRFQTPKVYRTVRAGGDLSYMSRGVYQVDYLTIEHNTGIDLRDEFILVGRDHKPTNKMNFTVNALKSEEEFRRRRPVVHEISQNIFVASTQFERPFDYSTSSWVRDNDCAKNVSKVKAVQKHYTESNDPSGGGQPVSVAMHSSSASPSSGTVAEGGSSSGGTGSGEYFTYQLKSIGTSPYMRLTVPGNMSILPFYFRNNGPVLLTNESLITELELTGQGRIWEIRISGKMSGCPAYLGIVINNRMELDELCRYDMLILCPSEFNLTVKIPNWGQHPDKTFDLRLTDASGTHDIYLTQLVFDSTVGASVATTDFLPPSLSSASSSSQLSSVGTDVFLSAIENSATLTAASKTTKRQKPDAGASGTLTAAGSDVALFPVVFLVAGCVVVTLLFVLAVAYVFRETSKAMIKPPKLATTYYGDKDAADVTLSSSGMENFVDVTSPLGSTTASLAVYDVGVIGSTSGRQLQAGSRTKSVVHRRSRHGGDSGSDRTCVAALYLAFWGVYSVVFTFTAVSLMVVTLTASGPGWRPWNFLDTGGGRVSRATVVTDVRTASRNVSRRTAAVIDRYLIEETDRIENAVLRARRACSDAYIGEMFSGVAAQMERAIIGRSTRSGMVPDPTDDQLDAVGGLSMHRARLQLDAYRKRVEAYRSAYHRNVSAAISGAIALYRTYLRSTMSGDWTAFPRRLFNETSLNPLRSGHSSSNDQSRTSYQSSVHYGSTSSTSGQGQATLMADEDVLGEEADFGAFIELEEVENVQLWPHQFWERFLNSLPRLPSPKPPKLNYSQPQCLMEHGRLVPNVSRLQPMDRLDSTHFLSYPLFAHTSGMYPALVNDQGPPPSVGVGKKHSTSSGSGGVNYAEEYRVIPSQAGTSISSAGGDDDDYEESRFRSTNPGVEGLFQLVDFDILRVIFIGLDALLLIHRITNAYAGGQLVSRRFGGGYVNEDTDDVIRCSEDTSSRRTDGDLSQTSTLTSTARHFQPNHNHESATLSLRQQQQRPRNDAKARSTSSGRLELTDGHCYSTDGSDYLSPLDQRVGGTSTSYSTLPKSLMMSNYSTTSPTVSNTEFCACGQPQQTLNDDDDDYPLPPPPLFSTGSRKFDGRSDPAAGTVCSSAGDHSDLEYFEVDATEYQVAERQPSDIVRTVVARMLQSGAVPKAIVAVVLTLVFYVVARSAVVLLDAGLLTAVATASLGAGGGGGGGAGSILTGGAGAVFDAVHVRINETNRNIEDEAKQLNDLASVVYGEQLRVELLNLQAIVEFFNAEQQRHARNFAAEVCSLTLRQRRGFDGLNISWAHCDAAHVTPFRLDAPILPCNFIPVQPRYFSGLSGFNYEAQLSEAVQPLVFAIKSAVTRTSYLLLAVVIVAFVVQIVSSVLFYHFRFHVESAATAVVDVSTSSISGNEIRRVHNRQPLPPRQSQPSQVYGSAVSTPVSTLIGRQRGPPMVSTRCSNDNGDDGKLADDCTDAAVDSMATSAADVRTTRHPVLPQPPTSQQRPVVGRSCMKARTNNGGGQQYRQPPAAAAAASPPGAPASSTTSSLSGSMADYLKYSETKV